MSKGLMVIYQRSGASFSVSRCEYDKEVSRLIDREELSAGDAQGVTEAKYLSKHAEMLKALTRSASEDLKALQRVIELSYPEGTSEIGEVKESIKKSLTGEADARDIEVMSAFFSRVKLERLDFHGNFVVRSLSARVMNFLVDFASLKFDEDGILRP